jgi:long-chain fatty acid transport protein
VKIKKIAALTALAVLPGVSSATVGYFAHGYGMKSIGMGGVGIALPQDALAAAANPAGMAFVGERYDIGLNLFRPDRTATISGNGAGADGTYDGNGDKVFAIPEFGYNRMVGERMSLGLSVYGNGGMNTSYANNPFAAFGASGPAGVDLSQLFIAPTIAYRITSTQALGASLNLAYQRFKAEGIQPFAGFSTDPANFTNRGYDTSTGFGVRLGYVGELADGFKLGLTWQSKTRMSEFDKYRGLFAENGDFDIPENYGIGISYATGPLTLAADVMEIKYSDVRAIGNASLANLGNGFGSANGPGFGWEDMTVYKIGASYQMGGVTLRAGYATGKQPINEADALLNILAPGVVEDHLTLGATWTLADKSEVTVGFMHAFSNSLSSPNAIPGGFGGGAVELEMSQNSLGIAYARQFK